MRKFSDLNNKKENISTSTNKKDFIKNLIEESLTVIDGEINGKDLLITALNKIIEMNDAKTTIKVLESVKLNSYRGGFDFNLITEAINIEKTKLNAPLVEAVTEDVKKEEITIIQESKVIKDEEAVDEKVEDEEMEDEEVEDVEEEEVIDENRAYNEVNTIITDYMQEKNELNSLYENILIENRKETKAEKIEFILTNIDKVKIDGVDKKAALNNMEDTEIEKLYKQVEKDCDC